MAAERPVIATRVGGVADAITHEVNGLLIAPGDVEGLAAALTRLTRDGALRARLGAAARDSAARYTEARVVGELTALYGRLTGTPVR
jgi:glycosyltransferase involved in cell wall biosynthesis